MTMQLELGGHPIHTRALAVTITAAEAPRWLVSSYVIDLRKRGFVPVGSELQGMGIIHHMELQATVDAATATLLEWQPRQPTVAFEASAESCGESCRDPIGRLAALHGTRLDDAFPGALRAVFAGALGCSHLLALAQLTAATVTAAISGAEASWRTAAAGQRLFRRDLVFDGHELDDSRIAVAVQLADLSHCPQPAASLPMDRFAAQYELRLRVELQGWPATVVEIAGGHRRRRLSDFDDAAWLADGTLDKLRGLNLGKGGSTAIARELADMPPARDALLMLAPALIQCRAAFPDKWLSQVATAPDHPGLIAMLDSCYMWRRGGGLERSREQILATRAKR